MGRERLFFSEWEVISLAIEPVGASHKSAPGRIADALSPGWLSRNNPVCAIVCKAMVNFPAEVNWTWREVSAETEVDTLPAGPWPSSKSPLTVLKRVRGPRGMALFCRTICRLNAAVTAEINEAYIAAEPPELSARLGCTELFCSRWDGAGELAFVVWRSDR